MELYEIDKLVAMNIMGWSELDIANFKEVNGYDFEPATNIMDAWMTIERLASDGFMVNVFNCLDFGYRAEVLVPDADNMEDVAANGKTAPESICKAVLKTVGINIK